MDETRRFIRYVSPGIAAFALFMIFCACSDLERTREWIALVAKQDNLPAIVATVAGVILGAGAGGYLLSVLHHYLFGTLYSWLRFTRLVPDFRGAIQDAIREKHLSVVDHETSNALTQDDIDRLSLRGAWIVKNCIWFQLLADEVNLDKAEGRSRSLWDFMHGSGTLFIGAVAALVMWTIVESHGSASATTDHPRTLIGGLIVCVLLLFNFRRTVVLAEGFIGSFISTWLARPGAKERLLKARISKRRCTRPKWQFWTDAVLCDAPDTGAAKHLLADMASRDFKRATLDPESDFFSWCYLLHL